MSDLRTGLIGLLKTLDNKLAPAQTSEEIDFGVTSLGNGWCAVVNLDVYQTNSHTRSCVTDQSIELKFRSKHIHLLAWRHSRDAQLVSVSLSFRKVKLRAQNPPRNSREGTLDHRRTSYKVNDLPVSLITDRYGTMYLGLGGSIFRRTDWFHPRNSSERFDDIFIWSLLYHRDFSTRKDLRYLCCIQTPLEAIPTMMVVVSQQ